jgi:hypothetical protein
MCTSTITTGPRLLGSTTTTASAQIQGTMTFEPVAGGVRLRWCWNARPKGMLGLLSPLVARAGGLQEAEIWAGLKQRLESAPKAPGRLRRWVRRRLSVRRASGEGRP